MITKSHFLLITFIFLFSSCSTKTDIHNQTVRNIILIIGDGLELAQVDSSFINNSQNGTLQKVVSKGCFKSITSITDPKDVSYDAAVLSIGKRSNIKSIGLDSEGIAHPNLLELASLNGMSTGLVTSGNAVHVTPASFVVHAVDKNQFESIASEYLNSPIDVFIGGGLKYFNNRSDGANLVQMLKNKGFIVYSKVENALPASKLMILIDENKNSATEDRLLHKYSDLAIQSLSSNQKGFILVVDGTLSDSKLNIEPEKNRMSEFDKSIAHVFDFADKNPGTLVIVTTNLIKHDSKGRGDAIPLQKVGTIESIVGVYAYGAMANSFAGTYDNTEIFNKIVSLLKLDIQ